MLASHGGSGNAPSRPASAGASASGRAKRHDADSARTDVGDGQALPSTRDPNAGCATRSTASNTAAGVPAQFTCSLDLEPIQESVREVISQGRSLQASLLEHAARPCGSCRASEEWANVSTEAAAGCMRGATCKAGGNQIQSQPPTEGVQIDTDAFSKEATADPEELAGKPLTRPSLKLMLPPKPSNREPPDIIRLPGQDVANSGFMVAHEDTNNSSSAVGYAGMAQMPSDNASVPRSTWNLTPFTTVQASDMGIDLPGTYDVDSIPKTFRESSSRGSVRWRSFRHYSFRRSSVEATGQYKKRRWSLILVSCLSGPWEQSVSMRWTRKA